MPNRWITHIKEYAEKNKLSYNCSLCDPNMRREYYTKYPKKGVEIPKVSAYGMDGIFKDYRDNLRTQKLVDEKTRKVLAERRERENKKTQPPPEVEYKTFTPQQIAFLNRNR